MVRSALKFRTPIGWMPEPDDRETMRMGKRSEGSRPERYNEPGVTRTKLGV